MHVIAWSPKCEGSTSSLVFPEFARNVLHDLPMPRVVGRPASVRLVGWVTPPAPMPMPRVGLELGVFLRLIRIHQDISRPRSSLWHLHASSILNTKSCKATCNICSLAAWCMGANYLGWVARLKRIIKQKLLVLRLCICADSRNDSAFLLAILFKIKYLYRVGGNTLGTWAYLHYSSPYTTVYHRSNTCFTSSSPPRAIPLLQPFGSKSEQGQNSSYSLFLA